MNGNTDSKYGNVPAECTFLRTCIDHGLVSINADGTIKTKASAHEIYNAVHDLLPTDLAILRDGENFPLLKEIDSILHNLGDDIDDDDWSLKAMIFVNELDLRRIVLSIHIVVCASVVEECLPVMFSLASSELSIFGIMQDTDISKPLRRMAETLAACTAPLSDLKTGVVLMGKPDLKSLVGTISAAEDVIMGRGQDDEDDEDDGCADSDGWEYKII